ncbi:MAG TPA: phosphate propanoyltransferase [Waddliaceae bacterium]
MTYSVTIEVSARHCHLSLEHVEILFGKGYQLQTLREISQPKQFAAVEMITLETKSGHIKNLRIIGPIRKKTQIEISATDARLLGIKPPVRLSGDIADSAGGKLIGPKGEIVITEGIIIAARHLHCDPTTASQWNLTDKQLISIKTKGLRPVTFHDVIVRINKDFKLSMHIDTDEANAAFPDGKISEGTLIS